MSTAQFPHAQWRKASHSGDQGSCVELAPLADEVGVRDSTDPHGPVLVFDRGSIAHLACRIRAGELNL